jgi:hypothetical protein
MGGSGKVRRNSIVNENGVTIYSFEMRQKRLFLETAGFKKNNGY